MGNHDYQAEISAKLLGLRQSRDMTQQYLADRLGVSFQAVSKWENGQSCPDISLLPEIADVFGIRIDELFGRNVAEPQQSVQIVSVSDVPWDDDGSLRCVLFLGHELLLNEDNVTSNFTFRYEGAALNVTALCNLDCDNIQGDASAGNDIRCGNNPRHPNGAGISGDASAGNDIYCGGITGDVAAGSDIFCGGVEGDVTAGNDVSCGGVKGDVTAGNDVRGDISVSGDVVCEIIHGSVNCEGDIIHKSNM